VPAESKCAGLAHGFTVVHPLTNAIKAEKSA